MEKEEIQNNTSEDQNEDTVKENEKSEENLAEENKQEIEKEDKPEIRSLDSLKDMPLSKQFVKLKGIAFKPLRLNDVVAFKLAKYMNPHRQNDFKVVVMDLAFGTPAFHSKNLVPGDVLTKINDEPVASSWNGFLQQLNKVANQEIAFESERGEILIV